MAICWPTEWLYFFFSFSWQHVKNNNNRLHQNAYFFPPLKIHKLITWPHQPEPQGSCSLPDPHSMKHGPQQVLFLHGMIFLAHNSIWVFNLIQHGPQYFCWTLMVLHYLTHPTCSNSSPRNPGKSPCFQASAESIPLPRMPLFSFVYATQSRGSPLQKCFLTTQATKSFPPPKALSQQSSYPLSHTMASSCECVSRFPSWTVNFLRQLPVLTLVPLP